MPPASGSREACRFSSPAWPSAGWAGVGRSARPPRSPALRGWAVAFLAWVALTTGEPNAWLAPTVVATVMGLIGTWASVAGNELSIRLGRPRLVRVAMAASIVCAVVIGFAG